MTRVSLLILIIFAVIFNAGAVLAKKDDAPGQVKKSDVTVGKVNKVVGNRVTVEDKKNQSTEVILDSSTKLVGKGKKKLNIKELKLAEKIALVSTDSATASRSGKQKKALKIFVKNASASAEIKRRAVQGVITGINGSVLTIAHQIQRSRVVYVVVTSSTLVKSKNTRTSGVSSLAVGQRVVAIGDPLGDKLVARLIHVTAGKAQGIFRRLPVASQSGTPVATGGGAPATDSGSVATESGTTPPSASNSASTP